MIKKSQTVESKVFNFDGKIRICTNAVITVPIREAQNLQPRIQVRNTVQYPVTFHTVQYRYPVTLQCFRIQSVP